MWRDVDIHILMSINLAHHQVLDVFMSMVSNKYTWVWLYLFITGMAFRKLGPRFVFFLFFAIITFALTDLISVHAFKNVFMRLRPCHTEGIREFLHMVQPCGGQYGFLSSHAANTTGIAVFTWISGVLHYRMPVGRKFFFSMLLVAYVLLNGYSRIYLGVHYPTDVLAGTLLGALIGSLVGWLWKNTAEKPRAGKIKSPRRPLQRKFPPNQ